MRWRRWRLRIKRNRAFRRYPECRGVLSSLHSFRGVSLNISAIRISLQAIIPRDSTHEINIWHFNNSCTHIWTDGLRDILWRHHQPEHSQDPLHTRICRGASRPVKRHGPLLQKELTRHGLSVRSGAESELTTGRSGWHPVQRTEYTCDIGGTAESGKPSYTGSVTLNFIRV